MLNPILFFKNLKKEYLLVFLVPFFLSIFLKYNYVEFDTNASLGVGYSLLAESISRSFDLDINEFYGAAGFDVFKYNGNWYVPYAPLNSVLMSIPLFFSNGLIKVFDLRSSLNPDYINYINSYSAGLINSVALGFVSLVSYKLLKEEYRVNHKKSLLASLIISLATPLFNYSVSFVNHILSTLFILSSFYFYKKEKPLTSGVFIGLSFLTEFPTVLISIPFNLVLLLKYKSIKRLVRFNIPIAISVIAIFIFNYLLFDHPLNFAEKIFFEYKENTTSSFSQNPVLGMYTGMFSPLKGLMWYLPLIVPSIYFLIINYKKHLYDYSIIGGYFLITYVLYSFWSDCWGASPLGPRYFSSIIPLILIPLFISKSNLFNKKTLFIYFAVFFTIYLLNVLDGLPNSDFLNCELHKFTLFEKALNIPLGRMPFLAPISL